MYNLTLKSKEIYNNIFHNKYVDLLDVDYLCEEIKEIFILEDTYHSNNKDFKLLSNVKLICYGGKVEVGEDINLFIEEFMKQLHENQLENINYNFSNEYKIKCGCHRQYCCIEGNIIHMKIICDCGIVK